MKATQRTLLALGAATVVFGLGACSDDDTTVTPTVEKDYYATATGNYWVYESVALDSSSNEIADSKGTDSSVVTGKETKQNKEAFKTITYFSADIENQFPDTSYSYEDGLKVYNYINLNSFSPIGETDLGSKWALTTDFGNASWNVLDEALPETELPAGIFTGDMTDESTLKFTPKYVSKGKKSSGTVAVTFENKTMQAVEVTHTTDITLSNVKYSKIPFLPIPDIKFTMTEKSYFVENIGLVKSVSSPTIIRLPIPGIAPFVLEGNSKILLRHNVK